MFVGNRQSPSKFDGTTHNRRDDGVEDAIARPRQFALLVGELRALLDAASGYQSG
jgi:hypothetical protein